MTRAALVFCLALTACGGAPVLDRTAAAAAPRGISLETDSGGLAIAGGGEGRIDFGRSPAGVIPLLERELGPGRELDLVNCPFGITRQIAWGDLVLTFTDEQFVGWRGASGAAGQTCGRLA